jgi:hypothetical protein
VSAILQKADGVIGDLLKKVIDNHNFVVIMSLFIFKGAGKK